MSDRNKSVPVTFRVTPDEREELQRKAAEKGQSVSQFVVDRVYADGGVTPSQLRAIYLQLLKIKDTAQMNLGMEATQEITKECDAIWQCLQS